MGAYDSLINFYTQSALNNEKAKEQQRAEVFKAMNELAGAVKQYKTDQLANAAADRIDPRGEYGGRPVQDWRRHAQGDFVDHTGGAEELEMIRKMQQSAPVQPPPQAPATDRLAAAQEIRGLYQSNGISKEEALQRLRGLGFV